MNATSPIGPEAQYQAFLQQGLFMLQRSRTTGALCVLFVKTGFEERYDKMMG